MPKRLLTGMVAALAGLITALPLKADLIINEPSSFYTSESKLIDISGIPDSTFVTFIHDTSFQVSFSSPVERLTVPSTWGTWNNPPLTESSTPLVLYSNGASSLDLNLSLPVNVFGFELEPDLSIAEPVTVVFSGPGTSISRDPSGNGGALLFALSSNTPITHVSIIDGAGDDFAIANVRYSMTQIPEPTELPICAIGLAALSKRILRQRRG